MSLGSFPAVNTIKSSAAHWNNVQQAMCTTILPRNSSGDPEDLAGTLGTPTYPFLKTIVKTGHLATGFMVPWYDYAGLLPLPQGWMICNGDQIGRATYNVQHRTNASDETDYWGIYVAASEFENLFLPGGDKRFLCGKDTALADGTEAIAEIGNSGSLIDVAHTHSSPITSASSANVYSTSGSALKYDILGSTHTHNFTLASALTTLDVTPLSIDVKFIMRIVE